MKDETRFQLWNTFSMAWTEVGLEQRDFPILAQRFYADGLTWADIVALYRSEILHGFAMLSCGVFLVFIPVVGWIAVAGMLPDWGYSEDFLRDKMRRFHGREPWWRWLNPLHILGYVFAFLFSYTIYRQLKRACIEVGMPIKK